MKRTCSFFYQSLHVAALVFPLSLMSCIKPDTLYDTKKLYQHETTNIAELHLVDENLSAEPHLQNIPDLHGITDGLVDLSLEQAVFYVLRHNRELQVQRYAPLIAGTFETIERGRFDAELFAEFQYSEETASETSRSTGERFAVEGRDIDATVGIRQQLPTGTDVETALTYNRSTSNRTPEQQEVRVGLSVTQALLQGFGPRVNLLDVRKAQLDTEASFYELRGFIEALVSQTEIAYWRYVLAGEAISIFEGSLDVAKKQLDEVENRIEVGVIPKNSAAAARAEVARRQQALLEAKSSQTERRLRLLRLLNIRDDKLFQLAIEPTSQPRTVTVPLEDLHERLELAVQVRPELNEARLRQRQQRLETVRTRNGLLPKLDFFIDIGKSGYADSFSKAVSNINEENYDFFSGIRLSSYLQNRSADARHVAALGSHEQAKAAVDNLITLVMLDVRLAANEAERTRQQIEARAVTRKLAEMTLQAEQERFSVGDITSILVAQAQRDLLVSQLAEIEAVVEYRIALVNLYLAEGSLLERRGVLLDTPVTHANMKILPPAPKK